MFLAVKLYDPYSSRFPRARGDVPTPTPARVNPKPFSPRTRGCSAGYCCCGYCCPVFPAHAGMFRTKPTGGYGQHSFPRARGDVPSKKVYLTVEQVFSPRTRGCSLCLRSYGAPAAVFPAHAGMFPLFHTVKSLTNRFPRARGDVPTRITSGLVRRMFSPRTRGCSHHAKPCPLLRLVFPAHAGMFRSMKFSISSRYCFPRARGDVPPRGQNFGLLKPFSPRTRGCSAAKTRLGNGNSVFPAHAGMFLLRTPIGPCSLCFPRARGDVP